MLEKLKENMAKNLFGVTKEDVIKQGLCINCGRIAMNHCYSEAGKKEYFISGFCEECFDELFGE